MTNLQTQANAMETDVLNEVCAKADAARIAQAQLAQTNTQRKNELLNVIADALDARAGEIAAANAIDMQESAEHGMDAGKLDRLKFDVSRVNAAAQGVRHVATLPDPIGEIVRGYHLDNGLRLEQTRVPIGVLGMIYEARPNVTVDVASLCIKSGNAVLLRGGHAAERTNAAILGIIADVLREYGYDPALIASVDEYGRQGATAMMQAQGHIDLLIPRGGRALFKPSCKTPKCRSLKPELATYTSTSTKPATKTKPSPSSSMQKRNVSASATPLKNSSCIRALSKRSFRRPQPHSLQPMLKCMPTIALTKSSIKPVSTE